MVFGLLPGNLTVALAGDREENTTITGFVAVYPDWNDNGEPSFPTDPYYKTELTGQEHETKNHNAWEYFANGYVKWAKDESAGHVTKESFWNNYRTWGLGVAYKPCVVRSRNKYGSLRIGARYLGLRL